MNAVIWAMKEELCPQCGEGVLEAHFMPKPHLECSNCEAEWDDNGQLIRDREGEKVE